jgi:hypothetical protein
LALLLVTALTAAGCAGRHKPATAAEGTPSPVVAKITSLRELCRPRGPEEPAILDESRVLLQETFCGATLWFDGLFGGQPNLANARAVSGRVEPSVIYTEADGAQVKIRFRLKYDLPNLKHRFNLFLGRDERNEFVRDRQEGFAIRSSVLGLEDDDQWLAGLGYSLPGRWSERLDFRIGGRLSTAPEAFVQGRLRRNVFLGDRSVWRLRETVFYENRDGFGSTSSADFDHVLRRRLLFHWGTVGTISEATSGVDWRSATVLYQNLGARSALAYELFIRGSTDDVRVREYGARSVYRRPLNRQWLFGELIGGYTWPRESLDERRRGSTMIGFGVELLFGNSPY